MEKFLLDCAIDVIKWNELAKGKVSDIDDLSSVVDLQEKFCREEFNELVGALSPDPEGLDNFVAEACDLFVVASFKFYLLYRTTYVYDPRPGSIPEIIEDIEYWVDRQQTDEALPRICDLLASVECTHIMEAKLRSNWTKLPKFSEFLNAVEYDDFTKAIDMSVAVENECARIELESDGRYKGVKCEVYSGRDTHLIFKDDAGKVVKPLTYKSWEEIYSKLC